MGQHHCYQGLAGINFTKMSQEDKLECFLEILNDKIHGLSFSPYLDGQSPGTQLSKEQIQQRMEIIAPYTNWIRSFSCIDGHELTGEVAKNLNLKTMIGINLSAKKAENEKEIQNAINALDPKNVDILAVGNEVLLREDLTEQELLDYIARVREAFPNTIISYVDAYYLFENHPAVVDACDVLLINCYPYWEDCPLDYSLLYVKEMFRRASAVAKGKEVIISETGWPSQGEIKGNTIASLENALKYFINIYAWAEKEGIKVFYFSSFDESWKISDEGDVGAYWGLWDKKGKLKYER